MQLIKELTPLLNLCKVAMVFRNSQQSKKRRQATPEASPTKN